MKRFRLSIVYPVFAALIFAGFTSCVSVPGPFDDGSSSSSTEDAVFGAIVSSVESIGKASEEITPEEEYYIGRSVAASIASTYPVDNGS